MNLVAGRLSSILRYSWWMLLLRGLAAIAFGVLTWMQPGITLATLLLFYGAYALVDGMFAIWTALSGRHHHESWWMLLLEGLFGAVLGALALFAPGITAVALVFYIAFRAIGMGVIQILVAIRLRKEIKGELFLILGGALSVAVGFLLIEQPGAGALALLWLIATYAVLSGILMVALAFRARSFAGALARSGRPTPA